MFTRGLWNWLALFKNKMLPELRYILFKRATVHSTSKSSAPLIDLLQINEFDANTSDLYVLDHTTCSLINVVMSRSQTL